MLLVSLGLLLILLVVSKVCFVVLCCVVLSCYSSPHTPRRRVDVLFRCWCRVMPHHTTRTNTHSVDIFSRYFLPHSFRLGLKTPDKCCGAANQVCCLKSVAAFPMDDRFVPKPVCACCCLACMPECGCCIDAPECQALNEDPIRKSMMERD